MKEDVIFAMAAVKWIWAMIWMMFVLLFAKVVRLPGAYRYARVVLHDLVKFMQEEYGEVVKLRLPHRTYDSYMELEGTFVELAIVNGCLVLEERD